MLLALWTFWGWFNLYFRIDFLTLQKFLWLWLFLRWFMNCLIELFVFILSLAHVSDWVALIRTGSLIDWSVFFYKSFRRWYHLFKSFIWEIWLIFLCSVFETKLLLRLSYLASLVRKLWLRWHPIGFRSWLSCLIEWRDSLFTGFFLHELLEKLTVFELCNIS